MQTITIATFLALLSLTAASPIELLGRANVCNTTPTASTNGNVQPIGSPTVTTADACQQQCEANAQCESFVFGLQASASTPTCMLFAVPASQVPSQGSNLNVFDKACSGVPTKAPTHSNPIGQ